MSVYNGIVPTIYPYYDSLAQATSGSYSLYNFPVRNTNGPQTVKVCRGRVNTDEFILSLGNNCDPPIANTNKTNVIDFLNFYGFTDVATAYQNSESLYYIPKVKLSDSEDYYYVDWEDYYLGAGDNGFNPNSWTVANGNTGTSSVINNIPLQAHYSITVEDSTGGDSGSTDLSGVEHAIYMIPATMFCIGFFIVLYRMFMRLRG